MRKPVLFILGLLLLALIALYFIVPQWIKLNGVAHVDTTDVNVNKFLVSKHAWQKWWPGRQPANDSTNFTYNGTSYKLQNATNSYMDVKVSEGDIVVDTRVSFLAVEEQLTDVSWTGRLQSSLNPITRIQQFIKLKGIEKDMNAALARFKKFMETDTNIYGIKVKIGHVADPIVIAQNSVFTNYPTTREIYRMIANVQAEVKAMRVKQVSVPMLNIHRNDEHDYQVMVAIPVDKIVTPRAGFVMNKLVKNANLLEADVTGGRKSIDNAFVRLRKYQEDHRLVSPAMPYEMILTDRLAQPDTTRWVTKVYWPIF